MDLYKDKKTILPLPIRAIPMPKSKATIVDSHGNKIASDKKENDFYNPYEVKETWFDKLMCSDWFFNVFNKAMTVFVIAAILEAILK